MPLAQLQAKLAEMNAAMQANQLKQAEEMKSLGAISEDTTKQFKELLGRFDELEKRINRPDFGGEPVMGRKTMGQLFVESKEFKEVRDKLKRYSDPFEVKEEAVTLGESGSLATPYRDPDVVSDRPRALTLRNFANSVKVTGPVTFFKQSARYALFTELSAQAAAGQANAVVTRSRGIKLGSTMTIGTGVDAEDKVVSAVNHDTKTVTFTSNLTNTHAAGVQLVSGNFDYTPEAKIRPAGKLVWTQDTAPIKTLARHIPVTEEMLEDVPQVQNLIDVDLERALEEEEEDQAFNGNGTAEQLTGILVNSECLTYLQSNGKAGDTKLDALRRAVTLLWMRGYRPSAIFVNPLDKEEIDLLKGDDGHYINIQMVLGGGTNQVVSVPLVQTPVVPYGSAAAGDWQIAVTFYDRREKTLRIVEPEDYSLRGMRALLKNKRTAFAIRRPDAVVKVSFDGAP